MINITKVTMCDCCGTTNRDESYVIHVSNTKKLRLCEDCIILLDNTLKEIINDINTPNDDFEIKI